MKRILSIFIALTAISVSSMAQTEKGKVLLGGYFSFSNFKNNGETKSSTNFAINPTAGVFITDNLVIGAGVGYSYSSYPINQEINGVASVEKMTTNGVRISPFGRYYVGITPQLKFFGHLEASVNWLKSKADVQDKLLYSYTNAKTNLYGASLSPGIAVFPSRKIGIELSISGFYFSKQNSTAQDVKVSESKTFGFGSDFFNPRLGMQFYL